MLEKAALQRRTPVVIWRLVRAAKADNVESEDDGVYSKGNEGGEGM